ncbi:hypothetical protein [Marinobacter sp.]|uniref:hypothetical protein n=1 Tax=Marinobacter sp. TaxID=50741 RepID=UPI003A93F5AE
MEEELKRLRRPYPQFKIELRVCSAIILLLVFGVVASISFQNWQHFERSGSLVVMLGVFIAWRDLSGKIDGQRSRLIQEFTARLERLEEPARGLIRQAINAGEADRVKKAQSEIDVSLKWLKKRVLALEACTLALGTLVWGYGGLIGQLVSKFA